MIIGNLSAWKRRLNKSSGMWASTSDFVPNNFKTKFKTERLQNGYNMKRQRIGLALFSYYAYVDYTIAATA